MYNIITYMSQKTILLFDNGMEKDKLIFFTFYTSPTIWIYKYVLILLIRKGKLYQTQKPLGYK